MKRYTATAREGMTAADVLNMSGEDLQTLAAAAVENAMKRREADSGRDLLQLRVKYQEDARQEAIADMLERALGDWIGGTMEDGTPRADMSIAYFAAICAGRALDRIMYQDGGHAVKLTAREARENYGADKETAADMARAAVVVETRRTSSPVAPAPEGALIEAERVERIFSALPVETLPRAVDMARAMYEGAESVREAGRLAGLTEATARRTWDAVKAAARDVLREDGDSAALERMIAEGERRRAAKDRAAHDASEAARAKALKDKPAAPRWRCPVYCWPPGSARQHGKAHARKPGGAAKAGPRPIRCASQMKPAQIPIKSPPARRAFLFPYLIARYQSMLPGIHCISIERNIL